MSDEFGRAGRYVVYETNYGLYFEHETRGDEDSCCVWLDGKRITDYDSCFVIPDEVGAWLSRWGYSVYYDFENSHWDLED